MMTDKLEKYVKDNRGSFDDLTPPNDIWNKIAQNNDKKAIYNRRIIIYRTSSIAAFLIIAFLAFNYFRTPIKQNNALSDLQKEMLETEQYYNAKVLQKKHQVFKLTSNKPEIKTDINTELAALDSAMLELKNDLKDNIANTEVVEAMIQNYRMKLQMLEDILTYLEPTEDKAHDSKASNI